MFIILVDRRLVAGVEVVLSMVSYCRLDVDQWNHRKCRDLIGQSRVESCAARTSTCLGKRDISISVGDYFVFDVNGNFNKEQLPSGINFCFVLCEG